MLLTLTIGPARLLSVFAPSHLLCAGMARASILRRWGKFVRPLGCTFFTQKLMDHSP
ncbi:hypothetical protein ATL17_3053 [Maritalea mobilis]|uniref:Uncharacterized protein n=2 Tax=Maritalea mobilis TaxID=483324 RepID=A0A4R6VJU4_9HYPH|nr:hypothetical protein ATL17_3053 [Maritalea mobilis]